ncbi:MAG: peptide deformylase [Oscillospiraceae bacterium]
MALRNILREGDPTLNKKCREVTVFNERLWTLLDDMRETLLGANGVGLAAPQVGVLRRAVLVIETNGEEDEVIELINPVIIGKDGEQTGPEGCLSVPGVYGVVTRPDFVTVHAFDRYGKAFEISGERLTARAFCHELDHLDGHLFTERAERFLTDEELKGTAEEED